MMPWKIKTKLLVIQVLEMEWPLLFIFNVSAWFWQVKEAASDMGKATVTAEVDVWKEDREEERVTNKYIPF